ncbi:MAG TPA: bifunctional aspartate kinase/homoserine dehydrogenase I [Bacteroidetes bacterium]|nr:bifunctional aspartate kinase/homoserine dehydrogenase I [Bacteroidota bacterium]HIL57006.1 bifunctional aspartate kinase/homoserine dehydrogenase I [Rhodothermales bacterium]
MARPFHVAKFGGTSVGTPERVRRAVSLATGDETAGDRRVVVVSAFGGVTDDLLAAIEHAVERTGEHRERLAAIRQRHDDALADLAPEAERAALADRLDEVFGPVGELLDGVSLLRECTPRVRAAIITAGERASAPLVAAAFRAAGHDALALDATDLVRTDARFDEATVDMEATGRLVREALAEVPEGAVTVVTGFVGSTPDGVRTTLGRSGSDYTATILGGALSAREVVIWTDVSGVLSADPRLVPEAFTLPRLSYGAAAELAHFGAKVLHPRTMRPLQAPGIPLRIANTLAPEDAGTVVGPEDAAGPGRIDAVTAVRRAALVRIGGAASLEVADLAARVFAALAETEVPVYLIAQASAEGSVCVATREADADRAAEALRQRLAREIERGDVTSVTAEGGAAVVAAVGAHLAGAPGLAGKLFATLGRAHVDVRAIAQGASEHTISCAVAEADAVTALTALHEAFALRRLRAHVAVIGAGTLGRKLLTLLADRQSALRETGLNLRLVGVADSRHLLFDADGLDPARAADGLPGAPTADLAAIVRQLAAARVERLVVVDATPSAAVAARHADLLRAGIAVVTPNKAATSVPMEAWREAQAAAQFGEVPYLYETAVGAGLGVVARLRDLVRTGARVLTVEGVLSGTLSYVLGRTHAGLPFSEAVREAHREGFTEPDPRDDLSGRDVALKLTLLAREVGLRVNPADVALESLVPAPLADVPLDEFWRRLPEADAVWSERLAELDAAEVQYVARLSEDGSIHARVEGVRAEAGSLLAALRPSEIAVVVHTERTGDHPIFFQGPGASADVTAAVLLADVARAAEAMR